MPNLTSVVTGAESTATGPKTPAQSFYQQYATALTAKDLSDGDIPQFYADNAVFHNQNGVDYSGDQIWPWIKQLFGQFEKVSHDFVTIWEIQNDDGTVDLISNVVRHLWAAGSNCDKPTVSVPLSMVCKISPNNAPRTVGGLQFKEVWLYWDTYKLLPYFSEDSILFRPRNSFHEK
ncbi:hypothetical protein N7537_012304 [Penicillium hordei]|uniref:SnoaL-like domain-containing protein n=1 Tax=Penicillium hordei TaxID=40994 RepID=A0AAD6DNS9_9EURO|nr:uncharacterized protein N7537_012304 [Penicillium hordei]KAJ5589626.1 hypothetical protein N7537_012304 [Penicillium hordei]